MNERCKVVRVLSTLLLSGWCRPDLTAGEWKVTAYADLDCAAHGFRLNASP